MSVPTHDRHPIPIAERPVDDWPGGSGWRSNRVNLEWFSFGEGLGAELAPVAAAGRAQLRVAR